MIVKNQSHKIMNVKIGKQCEGHRIPGEGEEGADLDGLDVVIVQLQLLQAHQT